jgi:hypothetical protein
MQSKLDRKSLHLLGALSGLDFGEGKKKKRVGQTYIHV